MADKKKAEFDGVTVTEKSIEDYKQDLSNVNIHTARGREMVMDSMGKRGFARPAFAASDGTVLGGNLSTMQVAPELGLKKVIEVETEGDVIIIHKRRDVEPNTFEALRLALEDNRAAEVSITYDAELLDSLNKDHPGLTSDLWNQIEWMDIESRSRTAGPPIVDDGNYSKGGGGRIFTNQTMVVVGFGRFASLVDGELTRDAIQALRNIYAPGVDPDDVDISEVLTILCKEIVDRSPIPIERPDRGPAQ